MPLSEQVQLHSKQLKTRKGCLFTNSCGLCLYSGIIQIILKTLNTFDARAQSYKVFMCRCSNYSMLSDGLLLKGMKRVVMGGMACVPQKMIPYATALLKISN